MKRTVNAGSLVSNMLLDTYRGWTVVDVGGIIRGGVLTDSIPNHQNDNTIYLVVDGRAREYWKDQELVVTSPGHEEELVDDGVTRIPAKNLSNASVMRKYKGWTLMGHGVITDSVAPGYTTNQRRGKIYLVVDGEIKWFYYDTQLKLLPPIGEGIVYHDAKQEGTVSWARCSPGVKALPLASLSKGVNCQECIRLRDETPITVNVTSPSIDKQVIKEIVTEVLDEREEEQTQQWLSANPWYTPTRTRFQKAFTAEDIAKHPSRYKGRKIKTYDGQFREGVLTDVERRLGHHKSCLMVLDGVLRYYTADRTFIFADD